LGGVTRGLTSLAVGWGGSGGEGEGGEKRGNWGGRKAGRGGARVFGFVWGKTYKHCLGRGGGGGAGVRRRGVGGMRQH